MSAEWYCRIMGDEWGPMSAMELIAVAKWGRLTRDDQVRRGSKGTWVRAELVRGLFNSTPSSATVSSEQLVVAARKASPARRSVRKMGYTPYWVSDGRRVAGPFSARQLREFAQNGELRPSYLISKDRRRWARAADVKGFCFGGAAADAATESVRSAIWLDQPFAPPDAPTADYRTQAQEEPVLSEAAR